MKKIVQAIVLFVVASILLTLGIISIPQVTQFGIKFLYVICGSLVLGYVYGIYLLNKFQNMYTKKISL